VKRRASETQAVGLGEVVNAPAQDVVLGHHFHDVEAIFQSLHAVLRGAPFTKRFRDRLIGLRSERFSQLLEQGRNVIVEGRDIEMLGRRERPHFLAPLREQRFKVPADEHGELGESTGRRLAARRCVRA
jgi:hypothetical protein